MLVHWIWFAGLEGISKGQKLQLLQQFSDPEELYYADTEEGESRFPPEITKALSDKDLTAARRIVKQCHDLRIHAVTYRDAAYPDRLRSIHNPPMVLYYKGILPDVTMQPVIGVVGTRKASPYGMTNALNLSREMAACGALIVSGGAAGVDTEALKGAMDAKVPVIAVLGSGVDVVFPAANRKLFEKIEENGCLLSEYPPGTQARAWQFPERNRIISGLSDGVLVVEAPAKSGALITARDAMEQGRDVFVVPGNINISTCAGSNSLLREGAAAVFCGWDVLKDYEAQFPDLTKREFVETVPEKPRAQDVLPPRDHRKNIDNSAVRAYSVQSGTAGLDALSQKVMQLLSTEPIPVDDVIAQMQEPAAEVLGALTKLALMGMIFNHPGRLVSVKRQ